MKRGVEMKTFTGTPGSRAWRRASVKAGGILGSIALGAVLFGSSITARAEHFEGDPDWAVSFTGSGMESNFKTADINDAIYNLQPGDSIEITLALKNADSNATDWWMTNRVLRSLEDTQESAASGGYTYTLIYQDHNGNREVLYSSDTVGGENDNEDVNPAVGLHEATDSLDEFFYLDTLYSGQQGYVYLTVVLDGESQGNGYQDTLADLAMNFAVEELDDTVETPDPGDGNDPGDENNPGQEPSGSSEDRKVPKTGDETNLMTYAGISLVSGLGLLLLALLSLRKSEKEKKGEAK